MLREDRPDTRVLSEALRRRQLPVETTVKKWLKVSLMTAGPARESGSCFGLHAGFAGPTASPGYFEVADS
jgi:hypothetical protein